MQPHIQPLLWFPFNIPAVFCSQTGFRLLNLKNDGLRKKFDSLKYDMKKVEEVVYDLSIRNLIKSCAIKPVEEEKVEASEN